MKLIADWRQAWRWWSVRLSAAGSLLCTVALFVPDALISVWHLLPAGFLARLPETAVAIAPLFLFVGVIVARVIQQRKDHDDDQGTAA